MDEKKLVYRTNIDVVINCPNMDIACEVMKVVSAAADEAVKKFSDCERNYEDEYNSISICHFAPAEKIMAKVNE